jgi:hypothetical protein
MRRRLGWVVLALVILVVVAAVVAVVTVRPSLSDARDRVDRAWTPLQAPLDVRYQALAGVQGALVTGGQANRTVTQDLTAELHQWQEVAHANDPAVQVPIANDLEGLAERVKVNLVASPRLQSLQPLQTALNAFNQAVVNPPAVHTFNAAVDAYQHARTGTIKRLVADVFGFGARPELELAGA